MKTLLPLLALVLCPLAASAAILTVDFDANNSGYSTDYIAFDAPCPTGFPTAIGEGCYAIRTDPTDVHLSWVSMGDHTTGTGNMMLFNTEQNLTVWETNPAPVLTIGNLYEFSFWAATVYPESPAELTITINGSPVGVSLALPLQVGEWQRYSAVFQAATSSPSIRIVNLNTDSAGNDFALDDISLAEVPEPGSILLVTAGLTLLVARRKRLL